MSLLPAIGRGILQMRIARVAALIFAVSACALVLSPHESRAWQSNLNGTANGNDEAYSVTTDAAGNVVAAGHILSGSSFDFAVAKLSGSSGGEIWRRTIPSGLAKSVVLDGAGDVLAAGNTSNGSTGQDFLVTKISGSTGIELWRANIDGSADTNTNQDFGQAIAVDGAGNAFAAGWTTNAPSDSDVTAVKLSPSGTILWRTNVSGGIADRARAIALDPAGDV